MNSDELWDKFCKENGVDTETEHSAWSFGGDEDLLLKLVLIGEKTATASGYELYEADNEELPKEGDYSIVLNSKGDALCIIQNIKVSIVPFKDVSKEQAFKEGEGDKSLEYWRKVHKSFFEEEYEDAGMIFSEDCFIVCEEFKLCYK